MRTVSRTTQFKRDFKRMVKRGKGPAELRSVVEMLCRGAKLPPKYRDHRLSGKWNKHRECHIEPDWLLIYRSTEREVILERTGSHSDLFK